MRPLRIPWVQATLAWALAGWLRLCFVTLRWSRENEAAAHAIWNQGGGVLCVFWHSRLALAAGAWPLDRAQPAKALISLSADGEFLARALARVGIPAVRGSSANKDKAALAKGGSQALRDGLRQLKVGALAITPDGPRGPAGVMAEGLGALARMSGAPVLLMGLSCSPAIRLNSWDRAILPLPFGRAAIVWDRVDWPEGGETAAVLADWTERLNAVQARADALSGLER